MSDLATIDKLKYLINSCVSVTLEVNEHRGVYEQIDEYLEVRQENVSEDLLCEMVRKDSLVSLQVYPDTPVGSFVIYHHDIDKAISEMYDTVMGERKD